MNTTARRSSGSVKKLSEGRYKLTLTVGYDNKGNQIRRSKTVQASSDRKANEELQRFIRECPVNANSPSPISASTTLKTFVEYWRNQHAKINNEEKTRERDNEILDSRILPALGHLKLSELTAPVIQQFLNSIKGPGMRLDGKAGFLSDRTIEMHFSVIHKILNKAVEWECLDKNRCSNVHVPHPKYRKVNVYDEPEMALFLMLVDKLPDRFFKYRVITYLAFTLGLRREEIIGLTWKHIDFTSGSLEISQAVSYIVGVPLMVKDPKNEVSNRTLGLTQECTNLLKHLQDLQKAGFEKANLTWKESSFVFTQLKSTKVMHLNSYNTWLKKFLVGTGLPKSSIHKLRHAFGTYQLAAGVDLATVKDAMGHADLRTTSLYIKSLDSRKRLVSNASETTIQRLRNSIQTDEERKN